MCGIWGFVGSGETVSVRNAWRGLCALTDRGPDDWGMYVADRGKVTTVSELDGTVEVALGNRRLSILDLSAAGNQPMCTEDGSWIVYNGEIYNYRELREELRTRGHEFDSDTDTEVVVRAYDEYGADCVSRFRGMFAFAVYNAPRNELFAARDRFGIKPFYYEDTGKSLCFASEVTSLLKSGVTERTLDMQAVDGFLAFGYVPGSTTIVEDVTALSPGTTLTYDCDTGTLSTETYWEPDFEDTTEMSPERLRALLKESVAFRLRSDVPVGAFLSGGLDSSTLVALMQEIADDDSHDLRTFSIDFDHPEYSEAEYAAEVAESFGTDHTARTISAADVADALPDVFDAMDQPTVDGVNTYFVSETTANAGVKVTLSGLGSDELLYGYPSFREVPKRYARFEPVLSLPGPIRRLAARVFETADPLVGGVPAAKIGSILRSESAFGAAYEVSRGLFSRGQRQELLAEPGTSADWTPAVERDVSALLSRGEVGDAVSRTELCWYMGGQLLRDTDSMSMGHSLEVRVPFLDAEVAEELLRTDEATKRRGDKRLLKNAMRDALPPSVLERGKSGFVFPFEKWLRDELAPVVEETLADDAALRAAGLDPDAAAAVWAAFERGDVYWNRVWALVVLTRWVDTYIRK